ncbi:aldo/keto reductase [Leifsonia kafniensis]|uniref:Aldo/keto reductase n=1 Tax=Leifsonia kafniensis TaxID=475957 RepID=A0ABP7KJC6_9MICO
MSANEPRRFEPAVPFGKLSFGAASLGNLFQAISDDEAEATLETAWHLGIRYFDTAPHYGLGLSERRLGRFLAGKPRDEFVISTKVGRLLEPTPERAAERDSAWFDVPATARRVWDYSFDGIRSSLDDSLERLGLDRVDVLYLHDPEQYAGPGTLGAVASGALATLVGLREEGVVSGIGVGSADLGILADALDQADLDILMVSNRYSLLDPSARAELAPMCLERGVSMVSVGVFNSGLLAEPVPRSDSHFEYGDVPPGMLARAQLVAEVCSDHGVELPAAALQYSLRHPAVVTVAVGAGHPEQVRQNHERMHAELPDELWSALREHAQIPV